jgi:hypothetical protein
LRNNIRDVIAKNPELNNYIDTKSVLELLPGWKSHIQLYSVTNIVTYLGNLLRSGVTPSIGD